MVKLRVNQNIEPEDRSDRVPASTVVRSSLNLALYLLFLSMLALIYSSAQITTGMSGGDDWPQHIFITTLAWLVAYGILISKIFRTPYLFVNAYLLALALFHLSLIYMVALGAVDYMDLTIGEMSEWYEMAAWFVLMAFGSYGIGIAVGIMIHKPEFIKNASLQDVFNNNSRFLYAQGIGLILASAVFLVMAIKSYGNIFAYTRLELYGQGPDSRGLRVFMMVFPGAVMLMFLAARTKKQKILGLFLCAFAVLLFMLSGYRSAALFPMLIGAVIWVKLGRKIPLPVAIGSIIGVLVVISVVGIFRQMGTYGELGAEQLRESYEKATIERSLAEMGSTIGVAAHVLRLVPAQDPYFDGASYAKAIKEMLPNVGTSIDASNSRMALAGSVSFDKEEIRKLAPSDWITFYLLRDQYKSGGGVGFSAIAEPYLNFGLFGVPVFFILLGFLLIKLDLKDLRLNRYSYLFAVAMLWPLIRTVRNDFSNFLKPLGFILIILLLWNIGLWIVGKRFR